jgi:hypothetical protein
MIEYDPTDRLDARLLLVLLFMTHDEPYRAAEVERESTVDNQEDPTWAFARALLKFQCEGDSVFARRALAEAFMLFPQDRELFYNASLAAIGAKEVDLDSSLEDDLGFDDLDLSEFDEAIATEIQRELELSEEGLDPLEALPSLFATSVHALLWDATEGASEWIVQTYEAGPSIRFDNGMLGNGPQLEICVDPRKRFTRCPECDRPTKPHRVDLVLRIEPGAVFGAHVKGRICRGCDVVCVTFSDLATRIVEQHPEGYMRDFISLGYLERSEPLADEDSDWLLSNLRPWRKITNFDANRLTWPTPEDIIEEVEQVLRDTGLFELFEVQQPHF